MTAIRLPYEIAAFATVALAACVAVILLTIIAGMLLVGLWVRAVFDYLTA